MPADVYFWMECLDFEHRLAFSCNFFLPFLLRGKVRELNNLSLVPYGSLEFRETLKPSI